MRAVLAYAYVAWMSVVGGDGMTEKEYRQHPAVSRSDLWHIRESPEKFKYFKENPQEPTPALIFGQALHKYVLQPTTFDNDFAVAENYDRRTKAGKEAYNAFCVANEGKAIITQEMFEQIKLMCNAIFANEFAKKMLMHPSAEKEKEYFWVDEPTGEECKCRADLVVEIGDLSLVVDIKTTTSADTDSFMRDAIKYGYDFQAGMYTEGIKCCTGKEWQFVVIAVEKDPPYSVNVLQADKDFVQRGYDLFREYIGIYHGCKVSGNWYGYLGADNEVNELKLPAYLAKEIA